MRLRASLLATAALSAFCLWRVQTTVWRPPAARAYLLPADTFLGRLEHCWLNDALYAFGMAAILYVLYTLKEYLGAQSCAPLAAERWQDHQERSQRMIGTGVTLILAWAWLEEIADLIPGYIFDKWDLAAIYLGFLLGCTMLQRLASPVFDAYPPDCPCAVPAPRPPLHWIRLRLHSPDRPNHLRRPLVPQRRALGSRPRRTLPPQTPAGQ